MVEWIQPAILRTPLGDLTINEQTTVGGVTGVYLCDQSKCKATRGIRAVADKVPQDDGEVLHRRFTDGVEFAMVIELWNDVGDSQPACGAQARIMQEQLHKHLDAILNDSGRYLWQPSDYGDLRMMDEARWLVALEESISDKGLVSLSFTIDTPFPYVIDATETDVTIEAGTIGGVPNLGNTSHKPVIIVEGAAGTFELTNYSIEDAEGDPLRIVYDEDRPGAVGIGGSDIAEIDTFKDSIYLGIGGEPGDDSNLKAGIDPTMTDYFKIAPGVNQVGSDGADITVKVNNAWLP